MISTTLEKEHRRTRPGEGRPTLRSSYSVSLVTIAVVSACQARS